MISFTDADIRGAVLPARIRAKLFSHRCLPADTPVAVRLNLTGGVIHKDGETCRMQTVHAGERPSGRVLGYDGAVTVRNAVFVVDGKARRDILIGQRSKHPMAAVAGGLVHAAPDFEGVEIRFNPITGHLFVEVETGFAVRAAAEVTLRDRRCYARGVSYWAETDAPVSLDGLPSEVRFTPDHENAMLTYRK